MGPKAYALAMALGLRESDPSLFASGDLYQVAYAIQDYCERNRADLLAALDQEG